MMLWPAKRSSQEISNNVGPAIVTKVQRLSYAIKRLPLSFNSFLWQLFTKGVIFFSKISPTYPWKIPQTFHQQFMKEFLSLWGFGEVWGIFPGYVGKIMDFCNWESWRMCRSNERLGIVPLHCLHIGVKQEFNHLPSGKPTRLAGKSLIFAGKLYIKMVDFPSLCREIRVSTSVNNAFSVLF